MTRFSTQSESVPGAVPDRRRGRLLRWVTLTALLAGLSAAGLRTVPSSWARPLEDAINLYSDGSGEPTTPLGTRGKLNRDSQTYRSARRLLPDRFKDFESKRFVVISDANPRWTRRQAELLDRTYHQFNRFTRRLGLKPGPLRHKLVCVLFEEHEDYQRFARSYDGVTAEWISGYYSPANDRIVFYNIETNPAYIDIVQASTAGDALPFAGRIADDYAKAATATTVHEAVHQLAFHTRIQSPHIQNPLWISEGLATAFETDRTNHAFGPDHDYGPRRERFESLLEDDVLMPLRELVTLTEMPNDDDETIAVVYHESYALVTWVARYRRKELQQFLISLAEETPGRPTAARHLQLFEQSFGDVDRLERIWLRSERD